MANRSKLKGDRAERSSVGLLRSYGLDAYRIPLSGAVNGFKGDIEIRLKNGNINLESKVRAKGFSRLYKWLDGSDGAIVKADRLQPLVVIPLELFAKLFGTEQINEVNHAESD